jgi:hypothetical protein
MKNQPTYDDANLVLRLYDLRREETMRTARKWFGALPALQSRAEFLERCPAGSDENAYFRQVTSYWEMAATFVATGVLNRELFYRSNNVEMLFVWEKIRRAVPELRAVQKNPTAWGALEEVAEGFIEYMNGVAPEWHEQFMANVAKIPR